MPSASPTTFSFGAVGAPQPAAAPQSFPKQIQFRWNGVDLGGPDATVVDFVGGNITATRGTGEDANKVTVTFT